MGASPGTFRLTPSPSPGRGRQHRRLDAITVAWAIRRRGRHHRSLGRRGRHHRRFGVNRARGPAGLGIDCSSRSCFFVQTPQRFWTLVFCRDAAPRLVAPPASAAAHSRRSARGRQGSTSRRSARLFHSFGNPGAGAMLAAGRVSRVFVETPRRVASLRCGSQRRRRRRRRRRFSECRQRFGKRPKECRKRFWEARKSAANGFGEPRKSAANECRTPFFGPFFPQKLTFRDAIMW